MGKWIAKIHHGEQSTRYIFSNRPAIGTAGQNRDMFRVSGFDREVWMPTSDDIRVEVVSTDEDGILEVFEQKDLDVWSQVAFELQQSENPDVASLGKMAIQMIAHYKSIKEIKDMSERMEEESES